MNPLQLDTTNLLLMVPSPDEAREQLAALTDDQRAECSSDWLARLHAATTRDPWILGFSVVHTATRATIGTVAFKAPPDPDGIVEIAYQIVPEHQNRGYATEACAAATAFALASGLVRTVRAHTLAELNASGRVLTKCGFQNIGEVIDPDDGLVWRWERHRTAPR